MKKIYKFVLITLLLTTNIYAQYSITGKVFDNLGNPLEASNVVLINADNNIITGTVTDAQGLFKIELNKVTTGKISISFIGFKTFEKQLTTNQNIDLGDLKLTPANTLNEVTITSKKKMIYQEDGKYYLSVQNSPLKTGYRITDLLRITPHVWLNANNNVSILGESATIMVNNRKVSSSYLSMFRSEDIKSIEVQPYQSADLDAESTGGVINIILLKKKKGFSASLNTGYTYKAKGYFFNSGTSLFYGTDTWDLYSSYSYSNGDSYINSYNSTNFIEQNNLFETNTDKWSSPNSHYFALGGVNQINKKHQIGAELNGSFQKTDLSSLGKTEYFNNKNLFDNGITSVDGLSKSNSIAGVVNYKWQTSDTDFLKVFFDYYRHQSFDDNSTTVTYNNNSYPNSENQYDSDAKTNIIVFKADYHKVLKQKIKLDFGLKHTFSDRNSSLVSKDNINNVFIENSDLTTDINYKEGISAGYISTSKSLNDNNYLKIGLRAEQTNINKTDLIGDNTVKQNYLNLFPSLYFSHTISDKSSVSLAYARSVNRPNFGLLNNDIQKVNDFQYYIGNPDLKPELNNKINLNYMYDIHNLSLYYKITQDKINDIYLLNNDIAYYKTVNLGTQKRLGAEYSLSKKLTKWWLLRASSRVYSEYYTDDKGHSSHLMTTYGGSLYTNFKLYKTTSLDASFFYRSPSALAHYKDYEVCSASMKFRQSFLDKKLNLTLSFSDIFNTMGYGTLREFDYFIAKYKRHPNRQSIYLSLRYNFSNNKKVSKRQNRSQNENLWRL